MSKVERESRTQELERTKTELVAQVILSYQEKHTHFMELVRESQPIEALPEHSNNLPLDLWLSKRDLTQTVRQTKTEIESSFNRGINLRDKRTRDLMIITFGFLFLLALLAPAWRDTHAEAETASLSGNLTAYYDRAETQYSPLVWQTLTPTPAKSR